MITRLAHRVRAMLSVLELWFDFSCPYAYLASRRARHARASARSTGGRCCSAACFAASARATARWRRCRRRRRRTTSHDMHRWAERVRRAVPDAAAHPMRTVRALRVAARRCPTRRWPRAIEALYAAYWQRGEDITRDDVIARRCAAPGSPTARRRRDRARRRRPRSRTSCARAPTRRSRSASSARRRGCSATSRRRC